MQIEQHLAAIERWTGASLSECYRTLVARHGGQFVGDLVRFYSADEVIERNECYETRQYCPGFLAIGDDSGGRAIVIDPQLALPAVFVVDHGSMSRDEFALVSDDLLAWIDRGCSF